MGGKRNMTKAAAKDNIEAQHETVN